MLTLGFVGLAMFVLGFLFTLFNMFRTTRNFTFGTNVSQGFSLHIVGMAVVFLGMICMLVGFAPTAWTLLLELINHIKK